MTARAGAPPDALSGWSGDQLDTLGALARAFVPGLDPETYDRLAVDAAEMLGAVADPDDLRLLRWVIRSLDNAAVNLLTGGGWARLRDLDGDAADSLLLGWAHSRLGRRRTAFQAFKRLLLFLAWTDPGPVDAPNPLWLDAGYAPPRAGRAARTAIRPLAVDRDATDELLLDADVVVVGSGAGGGVVACRLAEAGRSVLVIEAGPFVAERDMPTSEAQGFRRLYLDRGTTATADLGITIVAGSTVGGGTVVNWTTCFDPPDWLRDEWSNDHGLRDFDGEQTDRDLARLRAELDLRPPSVIPPKDQAILDGARALGWEAGPTERNAGPCTDCGACGFGCRSGAKRSGIRVHLARAHAAGARILADAPVERVDLDGGEATGVRGWLPAADGRRRRPFRVVARQVVLAAGALRTPLLLADSGIGHPQLGANLHLHPAVVIGTRLPHLVETWRGPLQAARSLEFLRPGPADPDGPGPAHGGFFIETGPAHPGLAASALPWDGGAAGRELMRGYRAIVPLGAALRDVSSGRVRRSRSGRPRIDYRLGEVDRRTVARAKVELSRLGRAAGAVELLTAGSPSDRVDLEHGGEAAWEAFLARRATADYGPNRVFVFSAHQMGSARAGDDPRTSVCDPWGRVRSDRTWAPIRGLYVADASLLPTAAGVNPMITIMALAERAARAVAEDG